jgi:hypothetical protein
MTGKWRMEKSSEGSFKVLKAMRAFFLFKRSIDNVGKVTLNINAAKSNHDDEIILRCNQIQQTTKQ